MEQVIKYDLEYPQLKNSLIRIGDLINMDGPMLVLFKSRISDELFLFDWVDNDEKSNRWLIYSVDKSDLISFLRKELSYKSLFEKNNQTTYFADIESHNFTEYKIYKLKEIIKEYKPDRDVLFDSNDSKNLDKILKELNLNSELNEKYLNQYNVILGRGVLLGFETQENFVVNHWPVAGRLPKIHIQTIIDYQPNASKSNRIFRKKEVVLQ